MGKDDRKSYPFNLNNIRVTRGAKGTRHSAKRYNWSGAVVRMHSTQVFF